MKTYSKNLWANVFNAELYRCEGAVLPAESVNGHKK